MRFEEEFFFPSSTFINGSLDSGEGDSRRTAEILELPESSIYHKGKFSMASRWPGVMTTEKDCVIIVEGYFDLLTSTSMD